MEETIANMAKQTQYVSIKAHIHTDAYIDICAFYISRP
jgi:hypothetical protein